jgi:hypothetical protein
LYELFAGDLSIGNVRTRSDAIKETLSSLIHFRANHHALAICHPIKERTRVEGWHTAWSASEAAPTTVLTTAALKLRPGISRPQEQKCGAHEYIQLRTHDATSIS